MAKGAGLIKIVGDLCSGGGLWYNERASPIGMLMASGLMPRTSTAPVVSMSGVAGWCYWWGRQGRRLKSRVRGVRISSASTIKEIT